MIELIYLRPRPAREGLEEGETTPGFQRVSLDWQGPLSRFPRESQIKPQG